MATDRRRDPDTILAEAADSSLHISPRRDVFSRRAGRLSDTDRPRSPEATRAPSNTLSSPSNANDRLQPKPIEVTHFFTHKTTTLSAAPALHRRILKSHKCNNAICAVVEVFETTELLELILSFLYVDHLLPLRAVKRSWHELIAESPTLRQQLFVRPAWQRPATDFQLLHVPLPGLTIKRGKPIHLGHWVAVHMSLEAANTIAKGIQVSRVRSRSIFEGLRGGLGRRRSKDEDTWPQPQRSLSMTESTSVVPEYETLYITQPPLVGMQAFMVAVKADDGAPPKDSHLTTRDDGCDDSRGAPACAKLSCDAGITLGFLAETTQSLLRGRKDDAGEGSSSKPQNTVVFKAIVSFCQTDTALRKRRTARSVTMIA